MTQQKIIIYDLETNSADTDVAMPVIMGYYSSAENGFHYTTDFSVMRRLLEWADVIVGYNNKNFDNVIMERLGVYLRGKVIVDLFEIIHGKDFGNGIGRKSIIVHNGQLLATILHTNGLDATSQALGGPAKIGDVDYDWFKVPFRTLPSDIQAKALTYLEGDLAATMFVYEYIERYFADFKTYLKPEQIERKQYITSSVAAFTYKALCNLTGLPEFYNDVTERQSYGGGFVSDPAVEYASDDIYCLDLNSLYPHIMIMCNLYGRVTAGGWQGVGVSETKGIYNHKQLAPVGAVLRDLYQRRLEYKAARDGREYTVKILINTVYGLLGNPAFASVHDYVAADDCTRIGRQWIQFIRDKFTAAGYSVLYSDTDSVFIKDPYKDERRLLEVKTAAIDEIKKSVPFPQDTFDMKIDSRIAYIQFEKSPDSGQLLKKHYLYIKTDGKVVIKGMDLIKSTCTALGSKIFNERILPNIKEKKYPHLPRTLIQSWVYEELGRDLSLVAVAYKVKKLENYDSGNSIQYAIACNPLYGEGYHHMIKLKCEHVKGAGIGRNYVGMQFKDEIKPYMIDLDKTMRELATFMQSAQKTLGAWTA